MSLAAGIRIGPYEVVGPIGAGGMGEVYRATDTRLRRDVAIKVLPAAFATDADRLRRFEQEALATAALNHPNILSVYDVGRLRPDGAQADAPEVALVVFELLEGETLREVLGRGPLPVRKAVEVATQLANGLAAAHAKGIVHRDLKPENVFLTTDERVKILDFGLAKRSPAEAGSGAQTVLDVAAGAASETRLGGTEPGTVMGTVGYMAPEQVRGQTVDHRADIFSFGAILYELLSGRRAFGGDSAADAMSAILKESPRQFTETGVAVPPAIERVVLRCLEKNPAVRFQSASDLAFALGADVSSSIGAVSAGGGATSRRPGQTASMTLVVGVALALAAGIGAGWWIKPTPAVDLPVRHFSIQTPDGGRATLAALSPDGRAVAFASADQSWVMRFDQGVPQTIPGAAAARALFWSPDGSQIGFEVGRRLWRVPASGGTPVQIAEVPRDFSAAGGAVWLSGDRIWFLTGGSTLTEVRVQGGPQTPVFALDPAIDRDLHDPSLLPDGRGVLYVPHRTTRAISEIEVYDGKTRRVVHEARGIRYPVYSPTGHILYASGSGTWAVPFSLDELRTTGEPFLVADNSARPSVSADGTLVMLPGDSFSKLQLTWAEAGSRIAGVVGRADLSGARYPRLSPDGTQVALTTTEQGNPEVFIVDVAQGTDRRLTFDDGADTYPVWSRDGRYIVYECNTAICARRADGAGDRVVLVPAPAMQPVLSPDDRHLLFLQDRPDTGMDVMIVALGPEGVAVPPTDTPRPLLALPARQGPVDISPDGTLLAYVSSEGGEDEVFLTTFPAAQGKWQVTRSSGSDPRWSRAGDRLFFQAQDQVFVASIARTPSPVPGPSTMVVNGPALGVRVAPTGFERSLDGRRILIPRGTVDGERAGFVRVIEQWIKAPR